MADDVTYTSTNPAGLPDTTKQATDEHATRGHMPIVKLAYSADGIATHVPADVDGLLVNLGTNNDVTVAGVATAANQSTGNTSLATIAGAVSGTEMQVDVLTSALPSGAATSANQSTEITALQLIDDTVHSGDAAVSKYNLVGAVFDDVATATVTENQAQSLRMTSARALHVQAQASTNNIGDVDVLTVPAPLSTTGGGTEATALRVTVASDSTGVVSVDDNGASLSVDWNGTQPVTGSGTATGALRVELANNGTGVLATVGTVTTVSTVTTCSTLTGGGVAHGSADSGNPVKIGVKAKASTEGVTLVSADQRTDLYADVDGILVTKASCTNDDVVSERVTNTDGASTAFTNFAAVASTHNCVSAISICNTSASAVTIDFRDGTAGSVLWTMMAPAGGGSIISCGNQPYLFRTSQNTALAFDSSAAVSTLSISVSGYQSKT